MTDDPNGWPDPARIARIMVNLYTRDDRREPTSRDVEIARALCATLAAEVQAREAAAAEAMREACAAWHRAQAATWPERVKIPCTGRLDSLNHAIAALRLVELPLPPAGALARMLAQAKREGMEEALATAQKAWPRAHTYASENADIYHAQDHAVSKVLTAIRARMEDMA